MPRNHDSHTHTHTHTHATQDAALYVREGEDNDKFYQHPRGKWSKRAYQALHSTVYHVFNLCVCTLLLFLALMEHPYVGDEANLPEDTLTGIIVVSES